MVSSPTTWIVNDAVELPDQSLEVGQQESLFTDAPKTHSGQVQCAQDFAIVRMCLWRSSVWWGGFSKSWSCSMQEGRLWDKMGQCANLCSHFYLFTQLTVPPCLFWPGVSHSQLDLWCMWTRWPGREVEASITDYVRCEWQKCSRCFKYMSIYRNIFPH